MAKSTGNKAGKLLVWILLALLIVGLAGFGIGSFGGSATSVGSVGDREITAQEYFRALNQAVRAEQAETGQVITLPEAEARGLPATVRGQLAGSAALDNEADRIGLSVSDATVAEQITGESAFAGLDGNFNRETYEFALRQNGWSVPEFEESVRAETGRAVLQGAVASGVAPPDAWVDAVMDYYGERRSFRWVRFGPGTITEPIPARSDADIRAFYDANPDRFTLPERKRITYAWITPDAIIDEVPVEESALRALYDQRIDEFVRPERRLVERLVFSDAAAAADAKAAIDDGSATFAGLVEERGLSLADVDLGEVTERDLGPAGSGVFALEQPGVAGPYPTDLGPALFRMNAILSASEVTFEEARPELFEEFARDTARRTIEDLLADYEDRLAAGATLEDLAAETQMELGTIEFHAGTTGGIADYDAFRTAAAAVDEDDFPSADLLEDGSAFALRLDEVLPPTVQPLEEVRAEARAAAEAQAVIDALREAAETAQATLASTGALSDVGAVEEATQITRDTFVDGVPPAMIARAFAMAPGETEIVDGENAVFLLQLDTVEGPDENDARITILRQALAAQAGQSLASDLVLLYARALTDSAGISFNDAALNAVHSQVFR